VVAGKILCACRRGRIRIRSRGYHRRGCDGNERHEQRLLHIWINGCGNKRPKKDNFPGALQELFLIFTGNRDILAVMEAETLPLPPCSREIELATHILHDY
jgi:hypothetical protein